MAAFMPSFSVLCQAQQQSSPLGMLPMLAIMFALMYFMVIRPQRRQQKEHAARLAALQSGDEIVTSSGIHGLVTNVSERTVTLKIADNVKIKLEKASVAVILNKDGKPDTSAPAPAESQTKA